MAAASVAKVTGLSLKELYESDDDDLFSLAVAVVNRVFDMREQARRDAERKSRK